ncbi:MAG: Gfo/Idh/MocA family oxidoreductase [Ruminococcaceae bacterium]|nr:Gfo/Idh/MocA family oxidoreductase [Oscillospiraceae bacterium]
MKEIRIAIIGTGMISHRHMTIWSKIPGTKIVAACDIDEKKLKLWGEMYGFDEKDLYIDFREMLKRDDIDAIDVCVHNNLHTPVSVAVMRAGFHCYCEKPMAASYIDSKILYDAQKKYGVKLAVQISSIFNLQTRYAKKLVDEGKLGKLYHARSVGHRREGRPGLDMPDFSRDFISKEVGGHGPLTDLGIYHIAQMLYIMGMPELETIYGMSSADYFIDSRLLKDGMEYGVEDLSVGLAKLKNGVSLDIYEDWAMHIDDVGPSFIAGSHGGIKLIDVDTWGGELSLQEDGTVVGADSAPTPTLEFFGYEDGVMISKVIDCGVNGAKESLMNPAIFPFNDNQAHWTAYLRGDLTDETRIDTPFIALETALLSDGIFLSQKLNRSVTRDEICSMSESMAIRSQKTPWGVIDYDF